MVEKLFEELSSLPQVEAVALGGSRAGAAFDEKSDYDVYLYIKEDIAPEIREEILTKYCDYMEIGNHFWEYEDNCTLKDGVDMDILYRNLDAFTEDVASVVERYGARTGYTTCMWHNLVNSKIICDKEGRFKALQERFSVEYPEELRKNIIEKNRALLSGKLPSYDGQIMKAVARGDSVSVCHRTAAFMESYFDIIFALNRITHPGEKRLVKLALRDAKILPRNFEENISKLYKDLFGNSSAVSADIEEIVRELDKVLIMR